MLSTFPWRCFLLRLSKKLTLSTISFLIIAFINPPKISYNQLLSLVNIYFMLSLANNFLGRISHGQI
jgi:hypothetical protein